MSWLAQRRSRLSSRPEQLFLPPPHRRARWPGRGPQSARSSATAPPPLPLHTRFFFHLFFSSPPSVRSADFFFPPSFDCMFSHTAYLRSFTPARRAWTVGFSSILTPNSAAPSAAWWASRTRSVPITTTTTTSTSTSWPTDTTRPPCPSL